MKKLLYICILFTSILNAQNKIDSLKNNKTTYLEDQLYVVVTYNLLTNKPKSMKLRGFSNTMSIGYIRDFPLNKKRNLGLGLGLGYARNTYFHNIKIVSENNQTIISDFKDVDNFSANKLIFQSIDLPFEVRIRKSTLTKSKFWRLYFGMKFSYIFYNKSQFNLDDVIQKYKNFDRFNKIQYGITTSIGHGTWNGYLYYGLSKLFDNVPFNDTSTLKMKSVRFGLVFYIL